MKWVEAVPAPNKSCGTCSMCCKLFEIDWLEKPKPAGKWCHHCRPGVGCAIYAARPKACDSYYCVWRIDPGLGAEWRPDQARFILSYSAKDDLIVVVNDPSHPDAHRREPYRTRLRRTAAEILAARGSTIVVFTGARRTLLFPDDEVIVPDGHPLNRVQIVAESGPDGSVRWRPNFLPPDASDCLRPAAAVISSSG